MVVVCALSVWRNVDSFYEQLTIVEITKAILQINLPLTDRFNLCTPQNHPCHVFIQQFIFEPCLTVSDVYIVRETLFHFLNTFYSGFASLASEKFFDLFLFQNFLPCLPFGYQSLIDFGFVCTDQFATIPRFNPRCEDNLFPDKCRTFMVNA